MLLNNVESDLKTRLEKEGITQKELAGQIGVSLPYVNRITHDREQLVILRRFKNGKIRVQSSYL